MRRIVCLIVLCLMVNNTFGKITLKNQQKRYLSRYYGEGGFDPERLFFGGSLGMNFFDKGYSIYVYPTIGYVFGSRLQMGISAGYNFYHKKEPYTNIVNNLPEDYPYSESNYNLSLFARLRLLGPFFIQAEPGYGFYKQLDSVEYSTTTGKIINEFSTRLSIPSVQVGGGFAFPIGDRVSFVIYALYDVIQNKQSPYYGLPVIRGGFNVGSFGN